MLTLARSTCTAVMVASRTRRVSGPTRTTSSPASESTSTDPRRAHMPSPQIPRIAATGIANQSGKNTVASVTCAAVRTAHLTCRVPGLRQRSIGMRPIMHHRPQWAGAAATRAWQDCGVGSLMLLDTASMYFRTFYGVPETVTAPDGTPVNAVRGLLEAISRLVSDVKPQRLVACLDADWRPQWRTDAIPSYKAHRAEPDGTEQIPPALVVQIPLITQLLDAAGI